ncbi:DSCAM [Culex quinquefasciatus]|uniref:DSCAM n=1 Tax=Culex quinquefasciatus TaxID=7176 RepID=B0WFY7_CULQU|nr:DSCAM [Culex quinquefasciatus]|eukprot:XP_001847621.1 DSCAM [Culex quinquefasciatus]
MEMIAQYYDVDVNKEYAIRGNSILMKCQIPSYVADFVRIESWHTDQNQSFYLNSTENDEEVVQQYYESEVNNAYVIRGNAAILKCSIPSFVADFVTVVSWNDDSGNVYQYLGNNSHMDDFETVVNQYYEAEVVSEYVIRGNTAVLKCNIPSFVTDFVRVDAWIVINQHYGADILMEYVIRGNSAILKCSIPSFVSDFVRVEAWIDEENNELLPSEDYVINQHYQPEILTEYVIRGNSGILKCSIPSFVSDFVRVESWIDEEGTELSSSEDYVVNQYYQTGSEDEYIIRGNSAILKCKIPSFIADFVFVETWLDSDGNEYHYHEDESSVVNQFYQTDGENEYVIRGNSAILKCKVPSFIADFVFVEAWIDSDGNEYHHQEHEFVVNQHYITEAENEYIIRGNSAILKCKIPSFIADFVFIDAWIDDSGVEYQLSTNDDDGVVIQSYEAEADNEYVIRGNSAIMKCEIPSFVSDFVAVDVWSDSDGNEFYPGDESSLVVHQFYQTRLTDEFVLNGNSALLKCLIPSFISDFVFVDAWISDDGEEYYADNADIVVHQFYKTRVIDEYVLNGNSALLKCLIPSFIADFITVTSWVADDGAEIEMNDDTVVNQYYEAQVYDVFVIKGNTALFKCQIPSFVADHVEIIEWVTTDGQTYGLDDSFDNRQHHRHKVQQMITVINSVLLRLSRVG